MQRQIAVTKYDKTSNSKTRASDYKKKNNEDAFRRRKAVKSGGENMICEVE